MNFAIDILLVSTVDARKEGVRLYFEDQVCLANFQHLVQRLIRLSATGNLSFLGILAVSTTIKIV